jgi:hypothetical protein
VVGAGDDLLIDDDAFLRLQLLDQRGHVLGRRDDVLLPVDDQAGRRAGRQEREVVAVRLRRDRDEAFDLGAAHQQLHADPGAEREASDPARARFRIDGLRPVERGGRIRQLARAMIERALAATDTAEVEAQHRKAAVHERVVHLVDDRVVHVAAELRVRVQHHGDRGILLFRRMVAAFQAACGTGENDFRHHDLGLAGLEAGPARNRQSPQQVVQAVGGRACQKRSRVLTWGEGQKASIANRPPA